MVGALRYDGKRVIVTGAATGVGAAVAQILVELGAEVHAIDATLPAVSGLASFSECDMDDLAQIDTTIAKIGKIVNALFNCADPLVDMGAVRHLTEAVVPLMIEGSAIASLASSADGSGPAPLNAYTASRSTALARDGIRINCVNLVSTTDDRPSPLGRPVIAEDQAWPMVFLNSPRAAFVTGAQLDCARE